MSKRLGAAVASKQTELMDVETGEKIYATAVYKRVDTESFVKVQVRMLLEAFGCCQSKQAATVVAYIVQHTEFSKNLFLGSFSEIAKATEVSRATVATTMRDLQSHKLITRVRDGVYQLSPALAYRGDLDRRDYLIRFYKDNCDGPVDEEYVTKVIGPRVVQPRPDGREE